MFNKEVEMLSQKWKRILQREMIIFFVCLANGLSYAIIGRIIGGRDNSEQIFYLTIDVVFSLLYFFVQWIW